MGPALALAILSVHRPDALRRVLAEDDVAALCLVPGVGKKTAARLLIELKSRLDIDDLEVSASVASGVAGVGEPEAQRTTCELRSASSATAPTRSPRRSRDLTIEPDADPGDTLRRVLQRLGGAALSWSTWRAKRSSPRRP